jgi:sugar O-acyltransferase (sialic acid O-acetyltransferase NeuD family)
MPGITYGIVGAGGFGRDVLPVVRKQYQALLQDPAVRLVFVSEHDEGGQTKNGCPVVGLNEFLALDGERNFAIAIADSTARARIAGTCEQAGARPFNITAPSAIILDENSIGEGAIICDFSMVTCNIHIGRHFHCNIYSYVEHDCWVGDFVTFAPSVRCNGNIRIENGAYIGAGAVIHQGRLGKPLVIGEGAVVGMGAVVLRDVAPYTTVVGNPARPLRRVQDA